MYLVYNEEQKKEIPMDKKIKSRLPPFTEALMNHTKEKQFPFDTPGHHGGAFYNLTEEGKVYPLLWKCHVCRRYVRLRQ